ncbi:mannose-1-phosphate guanylyltransferase/mannose-6-phosphate isomerase [Ferrimonas sediminicola]|uniref:mannose-1-phosphate guanylyltransferase n=1 Tax=Ferrimonas sediminicola TaxID=2569538 RepID=A0A4U1BB95_9GAMM|nr:mannose-1-phosphate guanylyltransferase/mannose-6-phosphate isomerase [Ferrimonas sediminicola]TKB48194.1 mannose-1-phosphate guanylyltransferase/mannose-6-phosphate isomerase [Ferrimonas sediminicola]
MATLLPVVLAGGAGTRLWPLSRTLFPKQFLPLAAQQSMLQETLNRLGDLETVPPTVICNEEHRFIVAEQLRAIGRVGQILLEPVGRNTAPALALAALLQQQEDPLLMVLAADHVITDTEAFTRAVEAATPLAEAGALVTFGVVPDSPHTGYGYIRRGDACDGGFRVSQFVEKPDAKRAQAYLSSGEYYWNSGMFLFRASRYLQELGQHRPEILSACQGAVSDISRDLDFVRVATEAFEACPEDSIDYAVMEHTEAAVMVPLNAGWSDVGAWSALWDVREHDERGNALRGDVLLHDCDNCLIQGDDRLIAAVGVDDLVVVDTQDVLLVARRERAQEVKHLVEKLKAQGREEVICHRKVFRPWGNYDSIDHGQRYQVKHITVKPGAKLSVQMHHHRAEHWVVVSGTARVTNGERTFLVTENESTYIPVGVVHALENPGKVPLELIEVQSGSYLGEDDIVRLQDNYGRT